MNAEQAYKLQAAMALAGLPFARDPYQANMLSTQLDMAQGSLINENQKKMKKEQEKKEKGKGLGSLGSVLGTAAGIAMAPATGGASLALAGGLGGALGGTAGNLIGGGEFDPAQTLGYGLQGATTGLTVGLGRTGGLANVVAGDAFNLLNKAPNGTPGQAMHNAPFRQSVSAGLIGGAVKNRDPFRVHQTYSSLGETNAAVPKNAAFKRINVQRKDPELEANAGLTTLHRSQQPSPARPGFGKRFMLGVQAQLNPAGLLATSPYYYQPGRDDILDLYGGG